MNHLSLFSGIGGMDLAAEWAGFKTAGQVEVDDYCNKVLEKHWPDVPRWGDIQSFSWRSLLKAKVYRVDVISAGFPCPAFSRAGKQGGFDQDALFYEVVRLCREIKPNFLVLENVEGIIKWRWIIHEELESIGYEWADYVLDAKDFGLPQTRRRYFAVGLLRGKLPGTQHLRGVQGEEGQDIYGLQPYYPDTKRRWTPTISTKEEWRAVFANSKRGGKADGVPRRMDRLRALGNSVPPQMCYPVFKSIKEVNNDDC